MIDPEYEVLAEVIKEETRKKFVKTLLTHELLDFKSLYADHLEISESNARHHLNSLLESGIVQKEKQRGTKAIFLRITPKYLERVRRHFRIMVKYAYMGMVGERTPGLQAQEYLQRLMSKRWEIAMIFFFTSEKTINALKKDSHWLKLITEFQEIKLVPIPIYDFDRTYTTMKRIIEEQLLPYSILADVSGATKIQTLALYSLAKEYGITRVYMPEKITKSVIMLP